MLTFKCISWVCRHKKSLFNNYHAINFFKSKSFFVRRMYSVYRQNCLWNIKQIIVWEMYVLDFMLSSMYSCFIKTREVVDNPNPHMPKRLPETRFDKYAVCIAGNMTFDNFRNIFKNICKKSFKAVKSVNSERWRKEQALPHSLEKISPLAGGRWLAWSPSPPSASSSSPPSSSSPGSAPG